MGGGISSIECRARIEEIKLAYRNEGVWSAVEDAAMHAAIAVHGKVWWKVRLIGRSDLRRCRQWLRLSPHANPSMVPPQQQAQTILTCMPPRHLLLLC